MKQSCVGLSTLLDEVASCLPHPWPEDDQNRTDSSERGDPIFWSPRGSTVRLRHQPLLTFDDRHL